MAPVGEFFALRLDSEYSYTHLSETRMVTRSRAKRDPLTKDVFDDDPAPSAAEQVPDQTPEKPIKRRARRRKSKAGRPKGSGSTEHISIRLDKGLVKWLRSTGPGWQKRAGEALKAWAKHQQGGEACCSPAVRSTLEQ